MTTLSDFGGGVDDEELRGAPRRSKIFPNGRCEAVIGETDHIRRCQNEAKPGQTNCHAHHKKEKQLSIHSSAEALVEKAGRGSGSCRGQKDDGDRCTYGTRATTQTCTIHKEKSGDELVEPSETELDQERIRIALAAVADS